MTKIKTKPRIYTCWFKAPPGKYRICKQKTLEDFEK